MKGHVVVIRYGSSGVRPGMPEDAAPTSKIVGRGLGKMWLSLPMVVSQGATRGIAISHVSPVAEGEISYNRRWG